MKTLIVSIYDGGWGGFSAVVYNEDYTVTDIPFNMHLVKVFETMIDLGNLNDEDEAVYNEYIKNYDHVIVCNDGCIQKVK